MEKLTALVGGSPARVPGSEHWVRRPDHQPIVWWSRVADTTRISTDRLNLLEDLTSPL